MSIEDFFNEVANAKKLANYDPFIPEGEHKLALVEYYQKKVDSGPALFARLVVVESTTQKPGTTFSHMWPLYHQKTWQHDKELSRIKDFIEKLAGTEDQAQIARFGKAMLEQNAGRGIVIKARGDTPKADSKWVPVYFDHVDGQTSETIAKVRAWIDSTVPERPKEQEKSRSLPTEASAPVNTGLLPPETSAPAQAPVSSLPFEIPGN